MEQIASGTSSSQGQDTLSKCLTQSFQNRLTKLGKSAKKYSGDAIIRLIFLIATFTKPAEIMKVMKEEFDIRCTYDAIRFYKEHPDYQNIIQKIRTRWGNDLLHVEFANKRRRLEELSRIYDKCFSRGDMRGALSSLDQIHHEVEKDLSNLSLTNYNINIFKNMSVEELENERLKSIERLKKLKGETQCHAETKNTIINVEAEELAAPQ